MQQFDAIKSDTKPLKLTDFKNPEDFFGIIKNENMRWLVSGIALGGAKLPGDPRPDWAVRAASEFWKCCQDLPRTQRAKSEMYQIGFMLGVIKRLSPEKYLKTEPELLAVASPEQLMNLAHSGLANAPVDEESDFYAGYSDGLQREQLFPRSPYLICLVFAVAWPILSQLKNVSQLHAWLEANLGHNLTGTRDRIAKICLKIHMPLADKGGRPKQKPRKASES